MIHDETYIEPWLRGTHIDKESVVRAVIHAFEMAQEDTLAAIADLTDEEYFDKPFGLSRISFHVKHIIGSSDRLFAYARGQNLTEQQVVYLREEDTPWGDRATQRECFNTAMKVFPMMAAHIAEGGLERSVTVGRLRRPTTTGAILVHVAEHTSRHVGQIITTSALQTALRPLRKA